MCLTTNRRDKEPKMTITAEDRIEIAELMGRYNQALDTRDSEVWAETFTEDGVLDAGDGNPVEGRSALKARVDSMSRTSLERHWVSNFIIENQGEEVTLRADMGVLKGNTVLSTGRYVNRMKIVDGQWKIARQEHIKDPG